ncbi:MAG: PspC domain-containing protein [Coriobacteriia bacterium]|nr:PspC domain-containing protein [Coriobacteriia bacterium]
MGFSPSLPIAGTRLMRSRKNRMIAGICGGIAEYFNVDPTLIRVAVVLLMLLPSGPIFIAYLIAWIVIPLDNR